MLGNSLLLLFTLVGLAFGQNVNVASTLLIIGGSNEEIRGATSGLKGYGIPFQTLLVPQAGVQLPVLNTTGNANYGGFVVIGAVSYDYGNGNWRSALTPAQWQQLYDYQVLYGVRMLQYDVYPSADFGVSPLGGCCGYDVEQLFSFSNTTSFQQAGIKTGATVSTKGLWHYPARITNAATTWEIARFSPNSQFSTASTAAVINRFANGRQQMVFFTALATDWSISSVFIQHAYISWLTKGLYAGYRRVNFNTQIDDMFLATDLYLPAGGSYRVTTSDMTDVANWVPQVRAKMNTGSIYYPELAHNGNGNPMEAVEVQNGASVCGYGPVYTDYQADTALEYKKPLGTGKRLWPTNINTYSYSNQCLNLDPLRRWFAVASNRDRFMHLSHTFTHMELNNATYDDALREIKFNQAWLQQIGLSAGLFSSNALVPPAITGLHNGDVLRAWRDAGLTNCVGDNTRPPLRNPNNDMHAYTTTVANDGYAGFFVVPRWATRIYYNCDTPQCNLQEWKDISAGYGDFNTLLSVDRDDVMRRLFGLYHDGYMFHQANLRTTGLPNRISIFQMWVDTMVAEFTRLVNWPLITLKQQDLAVTFADRAVRDACNYRLTWQQTAGAITGFTVSSNGNSCGADIPVTVPLGTTLSSLSGARSEKIGNDPQTIWVRLTGATKTFRFTTAFRA